MSDDPRALTPESRPAAPVPPQDGPGSPLAQVIESGLFDCGDAACIGIHDLDSLPGESREDWLARLRERFSGSELLPPAPYAASRSHVVLVPCPACTKSMPAGGRCIGCFKRNSRVFGSRLADDGRLLCRRCGAERQPNHPCYACASVTKAGRKAAL